MSEKEEIYWISVNSIRDYIIFLEKWFDYFIGTGLRFLVLNNLFLMNLNDQFNRWLTLG